MNETEMCSRCEGTGNVHGAFIDVHLTCDICDGTGRVPPGQQDRLERGMEHRAERLHRGMSLRVYCERHSLDPVAVSQYERGKDVPRPKSPLQ